MFKVMTQRQYRHVTAVFLTIFALAHLVRVIFGWSIVIAGWYTPMWLSWVAIILLAGLAFYGFKLSRDTE